MTALDRPRKILYVTAEMAPLLSTGGLAEIANALPRALRQQGHDIRVAMPCYRDIPEEHRGEPRHMCVADLGATVEHGVLRESRVPDTDIPLYLIEHEGFFGRDQPYGVGAHEYVDNAQRFCFFCRALLHGIPQTNWKPDIVHCQDWHTAAIPAYLKSDLHDDPAWRGMPSVLTIHNLAFQGRYKATHFKNTGLEDDLFAPEYAEFHGDMNLLKAGIALASKITTVSPRYAKEIQTPEYGAGLDGVLRDRKADLIGILNGIDYQLWDPRSDPMLPANYDADDLAGKATCKAALQEHFTLPKRDVPLFGLVSRLFWQKGIDLILDALPTLARRDLQIVVQGTGDPDLEQRLTDAAKQYPDMVALELKFDTKLAHRIQAGSDFFLMPSRYEPCGLTQLHSMAYGTIPIVRHTGGLADSVQNLNPVHHANGTATGISFIPLTPQAIVRAVDRALELHQSPTAYAAVQRNGMHQKFSWDRASEDYLETYDTATLSP